MMRNLLILLIFLLPSCSRVFFVDNTRLIPAPKEPVEIEFQSHRGLLFIKATINGKKGLFLFDNGFSHSAVNPAFAKKAGIVFDKDVKLSDAHDRSVHIHKTTLDTLHIRDQTFVNTMVYQIDTDNFLPCYKFDGILGASVINEINWKIDFDTEKMLLSSVPFPATGTELRVTYLENNSATLPLALGNRTFNTKIDFGKTGNFQVRQALVEEYFKGEKVVETYGVTSFSTHGPGDPETKYKLAAGQSIWYGEEALPLPAQVRISEDLKYEAYLGMGYLRKYSPLVINSTLATYVLPDTNSSAYMANDTAYGMVIYKTGENKWQIIQKNVTDPMMKDIRVNDEVVAINGRPFINFTLCDYQDYIKDKLDKKDTVFLEIKGRKEILSLTPRKPTETIFD